MSVAARPLIALDNSYVRELPGLYEPWQAAPAPAPRLLVLNRELAAQQRATTGANGAPVIAVLPDVPLAEPPVR